MGQSNSKTTVLFNNLFGYEVEITEVSCNNKPYTQQELIIGQKQKQLLLKTTILICGIFALIALILLFISFISIDFKYILFNELMPFMVTFVIGAICIILYLSFKIYDFKLDRKCDNTNANAVDDNINCPDYWTLSYNNNSYTCSPNPNIFSKEKTFKFDPNMKITNTAEISSSVDKGSLWDSNSVNFSTQPYHLYKNLNDTAVNSTLNMSATELSTFQDSAMNMANYGSASNTSDATNGTYLPNSTDNTLSPVIYNSAGTPIRIQKANGSNTGTSIPLLCDQVKPGLLATEDATYAAVNPDVTNKFRCAYAKACGVTWSDANCE